MCVLQNTLTIHKELPLIKFQMRNRIFGEICKAKIMKHEHLVTFFDKMYGI